MDDRAGHTDSSLRSYSCSNMSPGHRTLPQSLALLVSPLQRAHLHKPSAVSERSTVDHLLTADPSRPTSTLRSFCVTRTSKTNMLSNSSSLSVCPPSFISFPHNDLPALVPHSNFHVITTFLRPLARQETSTATSGWCRPRSGRRRCLRDQQSPVVGPHPRCPSARSGRSASSSRLSYRNKINREEVHRTVMDLRPSSSGHVS